MQNSLKITQLNTSANELTKVIENELWDEATVLSQKWDQNVRDFISGLSAKQFINMKKEIEDIASQNTRIETLLIELRAKVLTQIQENKYSNNAIQLYHKTA